MKVIVAGGREYKPTEKAFEWLKKNLLAVKATEVVSGCAEGADKFGEAMAHILKLPIKQFPAAWDTYGRGAGAIRNEEMAQYADVCFLFPGGRGTENMKELAMRYKLPLKEYKEVM
jgi:hypothetical protein